MSRHFAKEERERRQLSDRELLLIFFVLAFQDRFLISQKFFLTFFSFFLLALKRVDVNIEDEQRQGVKMNGGGRERDW
jgi:hypothetical protein